MVPIPIESLKNDRPSAVSRTAGVIFERSGAKRKARPSAAAGRVRLRTQRTSSRMKSSGISLRVTASIPLETPSMMMLPVTPRTTHCQSREEKGSEISAPKALPATFGSVVAISPTIDLKT